MGRVYWNRGTKAMQDVTTALTTLYAIADPMDDRAIVSLAVLAGGHLRRFDTEFFLSPALGAVKPDYGLYSYPFPLDSTCAAAFRSQVFRGFPHAGSDDAERDYQLEIFANMATT